MLDIFQLKKRRKSLLIFLEALPTFFSLWQIAEYPLMIEQKMLWAHREKVMQKHG